MAQQTWKDKADSELIQGCLAGNAAAWDALIDRYQRLIFSIALRAGVPPSDADDIFQDVCLKLCLYLSELRDPGLIVAWLGSITRQECRRWHRRRLTESLEAAQDIPADVPTLEDAVYHAEREQALHQAMEQLSEECRNLLGMLYGPEQLPYAEVAKRLGVAIGGIGPRRARCLARLKKRMGPYGE